MAAVLGRAITNAGVRLYLDMPRTTPSRVLARCLLLASLTAISGCLGLDEVEPSEREVSSQLTDLPGKLMQVCDRDFVVGDKQDEMALLYCATGPIQRQGTAPPPSYPRYRRLVIAQHGRGGDARKYFETITNLAAGYREPTFVIAPQLLNPAEVMKQFDGTFGFLQGWHFQWGSQWAIGGLSSAANGEPFTRSSFELYERVIAAAIPLLPNLKEIVIVGHSAGGQLVNRFAASNVIKFPQGVNVRYIPMNPQSWLYLSGERPYPLPVIDGDLDVSLHTMCPAYNQYWTGLDNLTFTYFTDRGIKANTIIGQFKSRKVINMVGELDTDNPDPEYDCRYAVQGWHRNQRAKAYYAHVMNFYAPFAANHLLFEVPNAGHSHVQMFGSACGRRWIFDDLAQVCN